MIIKYTSCDGSEVEERIIEVKFFQLVGIPGEVYLHCIRPSDSKWNGIFEVDADRVEWIKE
jgi:hypothetical protein